MEMREQIAHRTLDQALEYLTGAADGEVAVFDATNVTLERRAYIHRKVVGEHGFNLLFLESICDDEEVIAKTVREVKAHGKDFEHYLDKEEAMKKFNKRIEFYVEQYTPVGEVEAERGFSYIKIINGGDQIVVNKLTGFLQSKIGYWVMNIRITPSVIMFCRHGESEYNLEKRIGGNSDLTPRGRLFADNLAEYVNGMKNDKLRVWTSWLKRTIDTGNKINATQERWKALNEIYAGEFENHTYEEIHAREPVHYAARERFKFTYRYPGGESYEDLCLRLESVIMELERQENILVIAHQAVLRCLMAYFVGKNEIDQETLPYIEVPLHKLLVLRPTGFYYTQEQVDLGVPAVSTHRMKGKSEPETCDKVTDKDIEQLSINQDVGGTLKGYVGAPKCVKEIDRDDA